MSGLDPVDTLAIQALLADYVLALDARDLETFARLWTADAVFELNRDDVGLGAPLHGRRAIIDGFTAYFEREDAGAPVVFHRHLCTVSRIDPAGDGARAQTGMISVAHSLTREHACRVSRTGIYYDRFAREGGAWRFAARRLVWDPPGPPDSVSG